MVMAPPVQQESGIMSVNVHGKEEEKALLCKSKRIKISECVVQPPQGNEVPTMENKNKVPGVHSLAVSGNIVQSTGEANGDTKEFDHDGTSYERTARSKLHKLCHAIGWKYPRPEYEEQGPPHLRLFTCKMTLRVETLTDTIVECCSDPKPQKRAAEEQAAQGIWWCLQRLGHVKKS